MSESGLTGLYDFPDNSPSCESFIPDRSYAVGFTLTPTLSLKGEGELGGAARKPPAVTPGDWNKRYSGLQCAQAATETHMKGGLRWPRPSARHTFGEIPSPRRYFRGSSSTSHRAARDTTATLPIRSPSPSSAARGPASGTLTATNTSTMASARPRCCWATRTRRWWTRWCGPRPRDRTTGRRWRRCWSGASGYAT